MGFILASFSFTQLTATPFLGRLSDRFGRRPVILISLAGNAAAGMGRLGAGIGLGMVLGSVIGSSVSHFGPWAPPLVAAAMALADLLGAFFFMPETRAARARESAPHAATPTLWQMLTRQRVVVVLLVYFLTFLYMTNMQVALALLTTESPVHGPPPSSPVHRPSRPSTGLMVTPTTRRASERTLGCRVRDLIGLLIPRTSISSSASRTWCSSACSKRSPRTRPERRERPPPRAHPRARGRARPLAR